MQSTSAAPISTAAPQVAPPVVTPFGPMRKREKPPVGIPGQRKPVDSIGPRPAPPTSRFNPDPEAVASWWQHAEAFANGEQPDRYDGHRAGLEFGSAA